MRFEDKDVKSIGDFINKLDANRTSGEINWFRGHDSVTWKLLPNVARDEPEPLKKEHRARKAFRQNAAGLVQRLPTDDWGWLFLMQHYGFPTRLLDWSESPLVALYFAVQDATRLGEDGVVWVLAPETLNQKAGLSASTLSNGIPFFGIDKDLESYAYDNVVDTAGQWPVAALAARNSPRIVAQHGVFTVFHSVFDSLETLHDKRHLWRYIIRAGDKPNIRKELELLRVNGFSMFPELDKAIALLKAGI